MIPYGSILAAQIGFQIANLSIENYKSVALELYKLINDGPDGSIIFLRTCLEQVNLAEDDQNLEVKLDFLALVIKNLIYQPNVGTVLCEALRILPFVTKDFLPNLSRALRLSLPEQIALAVALTEAEDSNLQQQGQSFLGTKVEELCDNPVPDLSEALIEKIFWRLYSSEAFSKVLALFVAALPALQPRAVSSLLLTPLLKDLKKEVNCLRNFDSVGASGSLGMEGVVGDLEHATDVVGVLEEIGFDCTSNVDHCKEVLTLGGDPLDEGVVARILGTVVRTAKGSEEVQSIHGSFFNTLCSGEPVTSKLTSWNLEILLDAIHQLNPKLDWSLVMVKLDFEGFLLPDENAFTLLMTMYKLCCEDPFPLEAVCGHIWRNEEGQLSFLKHAIVADPDVFTFCHSTWKLAETQEGKAKSQNYAWLSLNLLDILCRLAGLGHADQVQDILEIPRNHCPELLAWGLAHIKETQEFRDEMLSLLLCPQFAELSITEEEESINPLWSNLWSVNPQVLKMQMANYLLSNDQFAYQQVLRICCDLKILPVVLDSLPFRSALELAVLGSGRGILNLEKWLEDSILINQDSFVMACLEFLQGMRSVGDEDNGDNKSNATHHIDTYSVFLKVLCATLGLLSSQDLVDRITILTERENDGSKTADTALSNGPSVEVDVDEEANRYFERVYRQEVPVQTVVKMLQEFNRSPADSREKAIFLRMVQCLFDELPLLHRYEDRELEVTAVLFGSLIEHRLFSSSTLRRALSFVLEAILKPVNSKVFSFALRVLDECRDSLQEWPHFCSSILRVPHIHKAPPELVEFLYNVVKSSQTADPNAAVDGLVVLPTTANPPPSIPQDYEEGSVTSAFAAVDADGNRFLSSQLRYPSGKALEGILQTSFRSLSLGPRQQQSQSNSLSLSQSLSDALSISSQYPTPESTNLAIAANVAPYFPYSAAGQTVATSTQVSNRTSIRPTVNSGSLHMSISGFGQALNIETLVHAAGKRDTPVEAPSSDAQDKVAFIVNNISVSNLEVKAKEFQEVLKEEFYAWFAQYIVMKRTSIEPNFHDLYIKFLDKINSKELHREVLKTTYENCKVLLQSSLIKTHSEERSLLKNLGSWLGKLTIRRNQALRAREIDPKALIIQAYEKGLMIAIIPFTSKVLEPCNLSLAYQPPNPWTMGILSLLVEIYNLSNLKMNLKFDIEVLFKNLNVDMKEVKPSKLLENRVREVEGNPDFSNKEPIHAQPPQVASESATPYVATVPSLPQQLDLLLDIPVGNNSATTMNTSAIAQMIEEEEQSTQSVGERTHMGQAIQSTQMFTSSQVGLLHDYTSYVVINSKLAGLGQQLQLARVVPLAMERAITDIITPVVDRSVTIACMTTRELVVKDYAMESDESRINQPANLMVASLAGSLAHVTCKEPLRVAMTNYLRNAMQSVMVNISAQDLDTAVNLITNDNLDLGCAVIEKAATEKAQRDVGDVIGPVLASRRAERARKGSAAYEKIVFATAHFAAIPESLRPRPNRLTSAQERVYEDFARLPWQNQTRETPVTSTSPPGIRNISGRGGFRETGGTNFLSGANKSSVVQVFDLSSEELEMREPSPLSFNSTTSVVGDGQIRLSQDSILSLPNYQGASTPPLELNVVDVTQVEKASTISPPLPVEQLGFTTQEPILTTGEALEKYNQVAQKLDLVLSRTVPLSDGEVRILVNEVPEIIVQCVSRDEAALAIAQKVFKRLFENTSSEMHVIVHLGILGAIRDVCKRVVKELTSWVFGACLEVVWRFEQRISYISSLRVKLISACQEVVYSDEERKFNQKIIFGLIQFELINLTDYNLHLVKWINGGRNKEAVDFAVYLVKTCVIGGELGVSNLEFTNVIEALDKLAPLPVSTEAWQQLVEDARGSTTLYKDEKVKLLKDKKFVPGRSAGVREEGKTGSRDLAAGDQVELRERVMQFFQEWARICSIPGTNNKAYPSFISQLQSSGMLKDDMSERFFRILIELAENHCVNSETLQPNNAVGELRQQEGSSLSYTAIDMLAKLVVLLVKYAADSTMNRVNLLTKVLSVTVRMIKKDQDRKAGFHPLPYFRLFVTWLMDFSSPDPILDFSNFQVLSAFANSFWLLQPLDVPGWSFSWLELISHRTFMPKLLLSPSQKGWPLFQRLLVALFKFMEPYLRKAELSEPVRLLYKGTLRVLLVLLHDFPEFLCEHHFSFCDVIPPSCIQMRNLILSAFPRNMRLPDPFTPNLKVDLLPEISQSPRILSDVEAALKTKQFKAEIDDYIKNRNISDLNSMDLKERLSYSPQEALTSGSSYNVPLLNALVLYVGMQAVQPLHSKTSQQVATQTGAITHSAPMDIFQRLVNELDTEGRYLFLNAIANQLRYPNNHTFYFSCVLLFLFAEASTEIIQEQITRVLLERLIVNRPHPWGLLITFIELIKNPRYSFWKHSFTHCAPEIDKLFESVARSCMAPPGTLKSSDDDLPGGNTSDG